MQTYKYRVRFNNQRRELITGQILAVKGLLTLFCPDQQGSVGLKR
ncbi:hypothetical protein [Pseudomonas frederiksbergensis]|nr:hypothetical protein [Pseudomonas frederiksbergensis]